MHNNPLIFTLHKNHKKLYFNRSEYLLLLRDMDAQRLEDETSRFELQYLVLILNALLRLDREFLKVCE